MSFDCITLSSDSSRHSSPNHDFDIVAENTRTLSDLSPVRRRENAFSLSDSESDSKSQSNADDPVLKRSGASASSNVEFNTKVRKRAVKARDEEKERRKAMKLAEKEAVQAKKMFQRSLQPGECMKVIIVLSLTDKYITAEIDEEVFNLPSMMNLEESLLNKELRFSIVSGDVKATVTWMRDVIGSKEKNAEDRILLCVSAEEVANLAKSGILASHVGSIKDFYKEKYLTLVICGLEEYFKSMKHKKKGRGDKESCLISRQCLEESLLNLQLVYGIGYRVVENSTELASLLCMLTKAVAETPFKRDKQEREASGLLDWFARGDSKDCVRVDSSGNGCSLLWRQQLRQFNNVGLDVAEAIASSYPSPQALIKAYKKCDSIAEAQGLLQNIPVRRGCGPLSSTRKVGPELSRKVHIYFTSTNGNQFLSGS
ncbi:crossover junction endonuclease EME1 isoform X2 [Ischnura elegans]|uniref:crossover junction endonuclease EME1 isoform X2 n=1 Tax=Ischnura elegans TaxID=197161 RepID=UPI001ED886C4|nr:crossover junction endonuclease EME1 isoform X2 [Ischnura elegans]